MSTEDKPTYVCVDPFAGQVRLNQLTPEEVKFRNDHMSGDPNLRQYTSMSYEERCQSSREYVY